LALVSVPTTNEFHNAYDLKPKQKTIITMPKHHMLLSGFGGL